MLLTVQAYAGHPYLMIQIASMPLSLVSTQAVLISHSTYSEKLLFFKYAVAVAKKSGGVGDICMRPIEYSSKRPHPECTIPDRVCENIAEIALTINPVDIHTCCKY